MKNKTLIVALAAALALPGLAVAEQAKTAPIATQASEAASTLPKDGEALAVLTAVNDHELKAAALARQKGVGAEAMAYAEMLDKEHAKNQQQTEQVAASSRIAPLHSADVELLKLKTTAEREKLAKLDGAEFEAAWIDAMVKDHGEALAKIDGELLPNAKNPAVAEHLRKTRDHIAAHLEQARRLDGQAQVSTGEDD